MPKMPKGLALGVTIGLVVLLVIVGATYFLSSGPRRGSRVTPEIAGPLHPGVSVRDMGSNKSKCFECESQAGVDGGKPKCITCTQPSFKYLTETIIAEQGADRSCRGCRGAP
jgi:hypothetical protein